MKSKLVPVRLDSGLVILHTWDEWMALIKGVDLEAARAMNAEITLEEGEQE